MNVTDGPMPPGYAPKRAAYGRRQDANVRTRGRKLAMGERALPDLAAWASDAPGQHRPHQAEAVAEG